MEPSNESSANQPPPMEVHHHGHVHEQKKWKEYVFQFIMLFFAVFLGFLAENLREKVAEKNIEREYIESFVSDLKSDYALASRNEISIFDQTKRIDTLQDLLFSDFKNDPKKDSLTRKCYQMLLYIQSFYSEFFDERTVTQLLSSGSMRLIKKQGVADSIVSYHSHIKFVDGQKQLYINSITTGVQSMYNVYDISLLKTIFSRNRFYYLDFDSVQCNLLTTEPSELKKFIAILETTKIVAFTYKEYLVNMKTRSERLQEFLANKYDLEE